MPVGGKSKFEDKGLDPVSFHIYVCPVCNGRKPIAEQYDHAAGGSYPVNDRDAVCDECDVTLDRE